MLGLVALGALIVDLLITGMPRLTFDFLTNFPSRRASQAGILSAWVGSLLVIMVTGFIAVPVGVAAGIYLEEYARKNRLTDFIEINVSNLAGVPSIIYGLLALGLFVYGLGTGRSIFTAGLALALLILPIIIVATREAIRAVPQSLREAARGIGATEWQVTRDHVLPAAGPGRSDRRHHRHLARARRNRAADHHRRADVHRVPADPADPGHAAVRQHAVAMGRLHRAADPGVQLDLAPRQRFRRQRCRGEHRADRHHARPQWHCDLAARAPAQETEVVRGSWGTRWTSFTRTATGAGDASGITRDAKIVARGVNVYYGEKHALRDVAVDIAQTP